MPGGMVVGNGCQGFLQVLDPVHDPVHACCAFLEMPSLFFFLHMPQTCNCVKVIGQRRQSCK